MTLQYIIVTVAIIFFATQSIGGIEIAREAEEPTTNATKSGDPLCEPKQVCGWAVYNIERRVTMFMSGVCECSMDGFFCLRTYDDISLRAYVYKCKQPDGNNTREIKFPARIDTDGQPIGMETPPQVE